MIFNALLFVLYSAVAFSLGNFVYFKNPKGKINRTFFLNYLIVAYWCFTQFCRYLDEPARANFWLRLGSFSYFSLPTFFHLVLLYTGQEKLLRKKILYYILYLPPLVFSVLKLSTNLVVADPTTDWGIVLNQDQNPILLGYVGTWGFILTFFTIMFLSFFYIGRPATGMKKQALIVLEGTVLLFSICFVGEMIIPWAAPGVAYIYYPAINQGLGFIVGGAFYVYAVNRYGLLVSREATSRTIITKMADSLILVDPDNEVILVNDALLELTGYPREEIVGAPLARLLPQGERSKVIFQGRLLGPTLEKKTVTNVEASLLKKGGGEVPVFLSIAILGEPLDPEGIIYIARDISERKREQEILNLIYSAIESSYDSTIVTDMSGMIIYANRAAEISFYDDIAPMMDPEKADKIIREVRKWGFYQGEFKFTRNGEDIWMFSTNHLVVDKAGHPLGIVSISSDITKNKQLERELLEQERVKSLSLLAGGIAHDFNNLLSAILGNLLLARLELEGQQSAAADILREAEFASLRARDLTQQLLTFSKGGAPIKETTEIGPLIRSTTTFVLRGTGITCDFRIPEDMWPVDVDRGQLSQVVNNVVINAVQAMPDGGKITVEVENHEGDPPEGIQPGTSKVVHLAITDEGVGIPNEFLGRIFDPYFTTKKKGSGLGLAVCDNIVRKHGGVIRVESKVGIGTTFHIFLPASDEAVKEQTPAGESTKPEIRGRVLFMDDDAAIRTVWGKILTRLDYEVDFASEGLEMIKAYMEAKQDGKPFDLVVLDLTIPGGMGGKEAMDRLLKLDPGAKAIVASGHSMDPVMANYRDFGFKGVLAKPYTVEDVTRVFTEVLERERD
ncbi:MAG: PAS domain S-box protein [Promethearchaeota archaeon]